MVKERKKSEMDDWYRLRNSRDKMNKMPRYRRDHRAMRPTYECPENNVSAKSATIAPESPHYNHHYSAVKLFMKYSIQCDHGI